MSIIPDKEFLSKIISSRFPIKKNPKHLFGYTKIIDNDDFSIYERPFGRDKVVAAYGDTIVKQHGDLDIFYIPDARLNILKYHIKLNQNSFPGLIKNSIISQCILIPYLRIVKKDTYIRDVRLCVITDKGQIFHNKPSRNFDCDGYSLKNDVVRFEESVVWDIPGRKHPTNHENVEEYECYYPGLPSSCYTISPISNKNKRFVDKYGNGGFPSYKELVIDGNKKICSRFYKFSTSSRSNPFFFIGSGERNDKMTLIGTYRANVDSGTRTCLFASSDGGREWFCKYEFSDFGEYSFKQGYSDLWGTNFGNKILLNFNYDFSNSDFYVYKRSIVLPNSEDGKIQTQFNWDQMGKIKRIISEDGTIFETEKPHNLESGNIVALKSISNLPKTVSWLNCSVINSNGTGDGVQFKVKKIDEYKFEIYELLSSQFPTLPCRHIHHINPLKDGWIVGTGEIYPNGWLIYVQQKMADTYSIVSASESLKMIRINTKEESIQRTMGMILFDTCDKKIIFASDHDNLLRNEIDSNAFKNISRGSTGIYVGKLEDVDDRNKFDCVYDAYEPAYFFQKIQNILVFAGQRGELAICNDPNYKKWYKFRLNRFIMYYMGYYNTFHIFNDYIILNK